LKKTKEKIINLLKPYIRHYDRLYLATKLVRSLPILSRYLLGQKTFTMEVINCGIPRSGSTLLHNIIQKILLIKFKSNYNFISNESEYLEWLTNSPHYDLVKIHFYSPLIVMRISYKKSIGFFTHRDIRDIVASRIQKGWIKNLNTYINDGRLRVGVVNAIRYGQVRNMNIIAYNDLINNKKKTIYKIAEILKVDLSEDTVNEMIEETSLTSLRKKLSILDFENVGKEKVNKSTGLHKNHFSNNPEVGKWEFVLTKEQEKMILKESQDYQKYFGYC